MTDKDKKIKRERRALRRIVLYRHVGDLIRRVVTDMQRRLSEWEVRRMRKLNAAARQEEGPGGMEKGEA